MSDDNDLTKDERRELMPLCTAFIDEYRKEFGDPVGILAEENGFVIRWGTLR